MALGVVIALFGPIGCVTDEAPRFAPRESPPGLEVQRVMLGLVGSVADMDDDLYPDTFAAMVLLWGNHYLTLTAPGTMTFRLLDGDDQEVVRWEFSEEEIASSVSKGGQYGPAYMFRLDIRDHMSDRMPPTSLGLTATFTPTGGEPLNAPGRKYILFGRRSG